MTRKRTFSLPDDLSDALAAASGSNASAYVAQALRSRLDDESEAERIRALFGTPDPAAYAHWVQRLSAEPPTEATAPDASGRGSSGQRAS